jgi:gamma-glutamylcyclotransferase (GGCT)/AIG2-like uncharacterized protein YtfP
VIASNFLFVYGTLRYGNENATRQLLARSADFVDYATYQGKLFLVDEYPGAIASEHPNDMVQGEVYKLYCPDVLLPILDRYEECGAGFIQPTEYRRKLQPVQLRTREILSVWVYLYNKSTIPLQEIPTGDFLKTAPG